MFRHLTRLLACVCLLACLLCVQGTAFEDVVMSVLTAGGPVANASIIPEYVRLHDGTVCVWVEVLVMTQIILKGFYSVV